MTDSYLPPRTMEQNIGDHLDYIRDRIQRITSEVEGLREANRYLSQRLTEAHQMNSALMRQRNDAEGRYRVLHDLAVQVVRSWDAANVTLMDELNDEVIRFREVLGLTTESQPLDSLDKAGR